MNRKPFETPSENAQEHAERIAALQAQATVAQAVHFIPGWPCGCEIMCLALFRNQNTLLYDGADRILSVCEAHAAAFQCYDTTGAGLDHVEPLYAELMQSRACGVTTACGCRLVYHADDRETAANGSVTLAPVEHPHFTIRCADHAHLTDVEEHHAVVTALHADLSGVTV